jgi:hypothetical protein
MRPAALRIDFVPASRRPGVAAVAVLALGIGALGSIGYGAMQATDRIAGLELRLEGLNGAALPTLPSGGNGLVVEAQQVAQELRTPWSAMLVDLESATADSRGAIALLAVEPDRARHQLKLTAEARSLAAALAYVQRLQKNPALRDALLDSHEVRAEVKERPVRVQITAEWRMST